MVAAGDRRSNPRSTEGQAVDAGRGRSVDVQYWKTEAPNGRVLAPDPDIVAKGGYAPVDWEVRMARNRVPDAAGAAAAATLGCHRAR